MKQVYMTHGMTHGKVAEFFEEHPRMMGALFTMALLLTEAGSVAANAASTTSGP